MMVAGDKGEEQVELSAFQEAPAESALLQDVGTLQISAQDSEAEQIKAALKAVMGLDNLTEEQWDKLVEKQRKLLAGEEVKEEVKVEEKVDTLGLFDVA